MKYILLLVMAILLVQSVHAVTVSSVDVEPLLPGEAGRVRIQIENNLGDDVEDVSFSLKFEGVQFIPIGSSEASTDELGDGDDKTFSFDIRPAYDIKPGDYEIPYKITFNLNGELETREGTIGVSVGGNPELEFSITTEMPVVGSQGKINLKIVNNGLADARFVSVRLQPLGYTLLSEEDVYIGTIDSDDFDTASFDVIFKSEKPNVKATVRYRDLDNKEIAQDVTIPIKIYTREKALELGIIQRNNWPYYIVAVVILVVLWFVWRTIKKRKRMKKSLER